MIHTPLQVIVETHTGYGFQDLVLMQTALRHPAQGVVNPVISFQRLEFLGDRALSLAIGSWLYSLYPEESEGSLSRRLADLVCEPTLCDIATSIQLNQWGLYKSEINSRILADTLEALLGAIFLDANFQTTLAVVQRLWRHRKHQQVDVPQDSKSRLQEWSQAQGLSLPSYTVVKATGPQHSLLFCSQVNVAGFEPVQGKGSTKKEAEKQAALLFLARNVETLALDTSLSFSPDKQDSSL